jgi:hypothetical protein
MNPKINTKALVTESGDHGIGMAGGRFAELRSKANGAIVDFGGQRECRHTGRAGASVQAGGS